MPQYSEKTLCETIEAKVKSHTTDYKVFIASRSPLNHAEYKAGLAVVLPLEYGEEVLKEIMDLAPFIAFAGSQVELGEERGVDILKFDYVCKYFKFDEILRENEAAWGVDDSAVVNEIEIDYAGKADV